MRIAQFNQIVRISSTLIAYLKHMNDETDFSKTTFIILLTFLWEKVYRLIITIEYHALLLQSFQHFLIFWYIRFMQKCINFKIKEMFCFTFSFVEIYFYLLGKHRIYMFQGLQTFFSLNILSIFSLSQYVLPHFRSLWTNILIFNTSFYCTVLLITSTKIT